MTPIVKPGQGSWPHKFRCAVRGVGRAVRSERNFRVHLPVGLAVVVAAAALGASSIEWCVLALCMAVVLAAEMFNTAIEHLARAMTPEDREEIRDALDISAGAVLAAAIGVAVVGGLVFMNRVVALIEWR